MGVPPVVGKGAVRLSLGRMTTETEIDEVLDRFAGLPAVARSVSAYAARAKSTWRGPEISATTKSDPLVRS
jgi:hypothetical protein